MQAGRNSTGAQRACPCGAGGGKGAHHAAGRAAGCRAKGLPPAARASLSGRCFVRRQNAPPPGSSFPTMRHARHIRAPMQNIRMQGGAGPPLCRRSEGIHTRGRLRVRSTDGGEEVQAGRNSTGAQRACPCGAGGGKGAHHAAGRAAGCRAKGLPPAARASLSGRCFVRRQNAPPPGPSFPAMRCKAVPHAQAGGAHAAGPPAPGFA